jgi:RNA-directed DNA polymerase
LGRHNLYNWVNFRSAATITLLKESDTPIQRHVKIKADANPHDPKWEPYFESRWGKKMLRSSRGRRKLYRVWLRQEGMCPTCLEPITKSTPWDACYIVKKTEGGSDAASNLQMHHFNCHRNQYYAGNAEV